MAATAASGAIPPSQLLRKLASYPRQHELTVALQEIGHVERTLFMMQWLLDTNLQRRAQIGLNKGEAHHALKNACGSEGRAKFEIEQVKVSIIEWLALTYLPLSSFTGIPSILRLLSQSVKHQGK